MMLGTELNVTCDLTLTLNPPGFDLLQLKDVTQTFQNAAIAHIWLQLCVSDSGSKSFFNGTQQWQVYMRFWLNLWKRKYFMFTENRVFHSYIYEELFM